MLKHFSPFRKCNQYKHMKLPSAPHRKTPAKRREKVRVRAREQNRGGSATLEKQCFLHLESIIRWKREEKK